MGEHPQTWSAASSTAAAAILNDFALLRKDQGQLSNAMQIAETAVGLRQAADCAVLLFLLPDFELVLQLLLYIHLLLFLTLMEQKKQNE